VVIAGPTAQPDIRPQPIDEPLLPSARMSAAEHDNIPQPELDDPGSIRKH
jgi:hypothetical protein